MGHQNNDKKIDLDLDLFFFNLGSPERQCEEQANNCGDGSGSKTQEAKSDHHY